MSGKRACSLVVHVSPDHADRMVTPSSILLYGTNGVVERAYQSFPSTQCRNCRKFGHIKPRCKNPVTCQFCAGNHSKSEHRCSNLSCLKEDNLRPILNCCVSCPPRCPNCDEDHSAGDRDCSARPITPPEVFLLPLTPVLSLLPPPRCPPRNRTTPISWTPDLLPPTSQLPLLPWLQLVPPLMHPPCHMPLT